MKLLSQGSSRHTVSGSILESAAARQTKVPRISIQTIALLLFLTATIVPSYSQETQTRQLAQAPQSTSEQTVEDVKDNSTSLPAEVDVKSAVASPDTTVTQTNSTQTFVFPTKRERFNRYVKSTVGPFSLAYSGAAAGLDQWGDNPEEWEQGLSGYGKRYASSFARNAIQQTVIYGLDTGLGLDTGFRKSTRSGFFPRMKDALAANITSRTKTGKRVISVPRIAGVYTAAIIQRETWYPERYSYKDGLRSGTRSLLTGFGINLIREFVFSW
jgi:hypothetical protein